MRRRLTKPTASAACAERAILPRLHLHEHHRLAVAGDDVQFATPATVAAGNDCVPAALQLATREIFAGFSESDSAARHARPR